MGDTFSLKITDKVLYLQHLDRSRYDSTDLFRIIIAALVAAIVIFILLPIIGVVVTLSVGFIVIFIVAIMASVAVLILLTIISSWLFGSMECRVERINRK